MSKRRAVLRPAREAEAAAQDVLDVGAGGGHVRPPFETFRCAVGGAPRKPAGTVLNPIRASRADLVPVPLRPGSVVTVIPGLTVTCQAVGAGAGSRVVGRRGGSRSRRSSGRRTVRRGRQRCSRRRVRGRWGHHSWPPMWSAATQSQRNSWSAMARWAVSAWIFGGVEAELGGEFGELLVVPPALAAGVPLMSRKSARACAASCSRVVKTSSTGRLSPSPAVRTSARCCSPCCRRRVRSARTWPGSLPRSFRGLGRVPRWCTRFDAYVSAVPWATRCGSSWSRAASWPA